MPAILFATRRYNIQDGLFPAALHSIIGAPMTRVYCWCAREGGRLTAGGGRGMEGWRVMEKRYRGKEREKVQRGRVKEMSAGETKEGRKEGGEEGRKGGKGRCLNVTIRRWQFTNEEVT